MALVNCKECGNQVSARADACPKCGAKTKKKSGLLSWVVLFLVGIPFIGGMIELFGSDDKPSMAAPAVAPVVATKPAPQHVEVPKPREFIESDFYWDKHTAPYKEIVMAGVNKIHRENPGCRQIDPGTASKSTNRGTPADPVFFVTCGKGASIFNVWFSKSDVEKGVNMGAAPHIDQGRAIDLCEGYAKANAAHPSTVSFSRLMDLAVTEHPSGRTIVDSTFKARNSFNLELKHNIRCILDANGLVDATISEAM